MDTYTQYIENYLMNDKTKSAIMLIGGWGTGKSFYIQNVLKPHLENKQENCCIVVSLYGLNSLNEISKSIYLEVRTQKLDKKLGKFKFFQKNENKASATLVGKTIAKGVTSFFSIDLSSSETDLQRLYKSIDLSGKLIILEDLERTSIPIKDVLSYVNNLVEQDGVKVLLVANEKELLKSEKVVIDNSQEEEAKTEWRWTAETEEYLRIKEKTISDTIPYICDYFVSIDNILSLFWDQNLESILVDKFAVPKKETKNDAPKTDKELRLQKQILYVEILSISNNFSGLNLRSLIFACQKTTDLLRFYSKEIDKMFAKHLFLSIVAFSFRLKENDKLYWSDKENGCSLGTSEYPLFKFAHDYIKYQILDEIQIEKEEALFLAQKKAELVQNDVQFYLNILYNFHSTTQIQLEEAITEIKKHLEKADVIDVIIYGKLANYLILARELIERPSLIDDCKKTMLLNLQKENYDGNKVSDSLSFHDSFSFWTEEQNSEYKEFIAEMQDAVKNKRIKELKFDYKTESIDTFVQDTIANKHHYLEQRTFLKRIDIEKLIGVIKQCNSEQLDKLRRAILTVYSHLNINKFFADDKPLLIQLKNNIEDLLSSNNAGDSIKKMQLSWFANHLDELLKKFN